MAKVFEDLFMDIQADMVYACMDYVNGDADKIYVYVSAEGKVQTSSHFYEIGGMVYNPYTIKDVSPKYDVSVSNQRKCVNVLMEDLAELVALCKEYNRPMPTEIKMIYDVNKNSLNADYKYEPVYSNHKTKTSYDVINEWIEEVKNAK